MKKFVKDKIYFSVIMVCILIVPGCGGSKEKVENKPQAQPNYGVMEKVVVEGVQLQEEDVGGLKQSEIMQKLNNYASKMNIVKQDAKLDPNKWTVVQKEKAGKVLNIEKTLTNLLNSKAGDKINLVVEEVKPAKTAEQLKENLVVLSSYSTPILDKMDSRVNNIEIAAHKIDYKKLAPGEEFSFNKAVGRRTEAKGFEEAPIIIKTEDGPKKGKGVGGGICQVSTTLYNAASKGGMEITERHVHSKKVGYVPKGKDATVSYGGVDLKFRNNRSHPVMIRIYVSNKYLTVKLIENRNL